MNAADRLFGLTGRSVDDRVAGIAKTAREVLEELQRADKEKRTAPGQKRRRPTMIGRWAARQLDLCVRTFERLPPVELVDLFAYLHQGKSPFAAASHPVEWYRATHYKALHPDASSRDLAAASRASHTTCVKWLKSDPDFEAEVEGVGAAIEMLGIEKMRRLGLLAL